VGEKKVMGPEERRAEEENLEPISFHFQFFHFPDIISLVKTCILIKS